MTGDRLSVTAALAATAVTALIIACERAFPFALFSRRKAPAALRFIEKYIPPMVIAALLVCCLKGVSFQTAGGFLPELAALALTVALHLWRRNSMLSIFAGTILCIILRKIL